MRRISAFLLCAVICASALLLSSCNNDEEEPVERVKIVRAVKNIEKGAVIAEGDLEVIDVRAIDRPLNALESVEAAVGKYAVMDIFEGDFLFPSKLASKLDDEEDKDDGFHIPGIEYTIITEYKSLANGDDYTAAIKKAIEENPGKTLYFPDGTYKVTEPVVIPAEPEKAVSLRLSGYAVIKAESWSDEKLPVIRIGVEGENYTESSVTDAKNVYVSGGFIDGGGMASGISVEGGRKVSVSAVTVKDAFYGLWIKKGNNQSGSVSADIENVIVSGNGKDNTVGVLVEGTDNTFVNVKVSAVSVGIKCSATGSDNVFKNVQAVGEDIENPNLAGFVDESKGNQYDTCFSYQFATGFLMSESARSAYNGCFASWNSAKNGYHVGFRADGKFNSAISNSTVEHNDDVATDAYLLVAEDGGEGTVLFPVNRVKSNANDGVLLKYCKTSVLK